MTTAKQAEQVRALHSASAARTAAWRQPSATSTEQNERLMSITDLSEMLGVPVHTLYGWRNRGEGPRGYRIGRHVRYRRATVEAWLATQLDPWASDWD